MNTTPQQREEQRVHVRIPSNRPVVLIVNHESIYATMTDFSSHGIGFITTAKPAIHEQVEVHFALPEQNNQPQDLHPFQFKAQVIHCIDLLEENHIGVKLDFPTKEYLGLFEKISHQ